MEKKSLDTKAENCLRTEGENMINVLPDDLLVKILMLVLIKDAVGTMILSKGWQYIWTMMPELEYEEKNNGKSIWHFFDKSLQLHKAPVLEYIYVELGSQCPVDVDVGKWIENAVDRGVCRLKFDLMWSKKPINLPESLYTCDTLVFLSLSNKIFVDIVSPACLPPLNSLVLLSVVFKDEDSQVGILSSCPILKNLHVERHIEDNVINFNVKVSSLELLIYKCPDREEEEGIKRSLVIDSPLLKTIIINDISGDSCSFENTYRLDKAYINVTCDNDKFMRSLASTVLLEIVLGIPTVVCFTTITFFQLIECEIQPFELDWLEPLMVFVQNCPKLKVLFINLIYLREDFPLSWNHPSSVPKCLLNHLEIFEWKRYGGRTQEKELVRYILANSRCLKRVAINNPEDNEEMMDELKSMSRISQSCQLTCTPIILQDTYLDRYTSY
ncbi:unnamed protein product [Thlaspi arvense]|uniref:FBD domain-containing protein n=1 Tax=Thlaspi arvense TaxID=13288 RepID=A0AAU9T9E9_THLAR|nr:unnamed protein product [Thlaspi arvense]